MNLIRIKQENCEVCKSKTISEEQDFTHCSGEPTEFRKFKCGAVLEYSANFRQVLQNKQCPEHPEIKNKAAKRKSLVEKLLATIAKSNCDESFREELYGSLRWRR